MTAAESLARWREVEQAVDFPWYDDESRDWLERNLDPFAIDDGTLAPTIDLIITSREAMPALLGFAEAVLELHEGKSLHNPVLCPLTACSRCAQVVARAGLLDDIDKLAEQHLGGAR